MVRFLQTPICIVGTDTRLLLDNLQHRCNANTASDHTKSQISLHCVSFMTVCCVVTGRVVTFLFRFMLARSTKCRISCKFEKHRKENMGARKTPDGNLLFEFCMHLTTLTPVYLSRDSNTLYSYHRGIVKRDAQECTLVIVLEYLQCCSSLSVCNLSALANDVSSLDVTIIAWSSDTTPRTV